MSTWQFLHTCINSLNDASEQHRPASSKFGTVAPYDRGVVWGQALPGTPTGEWSSPALRPPASGARVLAALAVVGIATWALVAVAGLGPNLVVVVLAAFGSGAAILFGRGARRLAVATLLVMALTGVGWIELVNEVQYGTLALTGAPPLVRWCGTTYRPSGVVSADPSTGAGADLHRHPPDPLGVRRLRRRAGREALVWDERPAVRGGRPWALRLLRPGDGRARRARPMNAQPDRLGVAASPTTSRRVRLRWRPRMAWSKTTLRSRTVCGETSTHSSSPMNSSACSNESWRCGVRRSSSSAVDDRTLVSFFSLVGFTSISSTREFSPTIMPSYTSVPAGRAWCRAARAPSARRSW